MNTQAEIFLVEHKYMLQILVLKKVIVLVNIELNGYWIWYGCNYSKELLLWHQWYGKNKTLQNCVTIMHGSKSVSCTAINSWLFIALVL